MRYLTTKEFGEKHGITPGRVRQLLAQGRVYPSQKVGSVWLLYGNSVIIAPHDRHGENRRKIDPIVRGTR